MAMTPALDLDLNLPVSEADFAPPVLSPELYLEWIESLHYWMKKDGTLADIIARRPRPVEELFVLP